MILNTQIQHETTLDPENWAELRELAHRMLDDMLTNLETVRERPVWQPIPPEVKARFAESLPTVPQPVEEVYQQFLDDVLAYPMGNPHPRFWGWVMGAGTPVAMLADMLAAGINPNMGGGDHSANRLEAQVIHWSKQIFGFPAEASGLLVSGGSMANLVGLAVARHAKAGFDLRKEGLFGAAARLMVYCNAEAHSSIQRAAEVLGLGSDSVRKIPTNDHFQLDISALEAAINADKAAGLQPFCIVGTAGTTNTGGMDDLNAIADICQRENLWFHVDGAFGAFAALSPQLKHLTAGMESADSLAFDWHKWPQLPFEIGCVLVRDGDLHRRTFTLRPDYLKHEERGVAGGDIWFSDFGIELTRSFKALKVWMLLKTHGVEAIAQIVEQNVAQARYMGELVDAAPELERLAPVTLNIVCFRYNPGGLDEVALDRLNNELLLRLQESGVAVMSSTRIGGKFVLRPSITNHRTRFEDVELVVETVRQIGKTLVESGTY
jgi:glutamate/tyrosine decarboxylase-like PLP-dependent enzyme